LGKSRFYILAKDKPTDEQMDKPIALSRSRYREWRLNTAHIITLFSAATLPWETDET